MEHPLVSRRSVLSLAVLTGVFVSIAPAVPAFAAATAPALPLQSGALRRIGDGAGVKRVFEDAFLTVAFLDVRIVTDPKGTPKLITASAGHTNQFQVLDLATGKLEYSYSLPSKIAATIGWDPSTHTIYLGCGDGTLKSWSFAGRSVVDHGKARPDATGLYALTVDTDGRVWGGSYPAGIVWNFDPKTKAFVNLARIDADTDYVRGLAIRDGRVYAGTGSRNPKMVSFPASNPSQRTVIPLPDAGATGFVSQIVPRGDRLFVFAEDSDNIMRCFVYNHRTQKWDGRYPGTSPIRSFTGTESSTAAWTVAGGSITLLNTSTMAAAALTATGMSSPRAVHVAGDKIYVAGVDGEESVIAEYSIAGKVLKRRYAAQCKPSALGVQSLIASGGMLYLGGYQGDGLASLNPDTGARWQGPSTSGVNQIEHMIEFDKDSIFIGSYGSAKLYRFTPSLQSQGKGAFKLIKNLRTECMQSRPFGWAVAGGKVFVGTVPEYGHRGGAFGSIDPDTEKTVVTNNFIDQQSIVGLGGSGDIVYGTTSGRPGYGAVDYEGPAAVFAYNAKSAKRLWTVYLDGHRELYSPLVIDGELIVSTLNGVIVMNPSNGAVLRTHLFRARTARPAWMSARTLQLPGTSKVVHNSGGIVTLLDLRAGTRSELARGGYNTPMAVTAEGRIFVARNNRDIVELHAGPNPTIGSASDLVTVTKDGRLVIEESTGRGAFGTPVDHGGTWGRATLVSFHILDWDADGIPDILAQRTDGSLQLHRGKVGGGFETPVTVAPGGWASNRIAVGNWSNDTLYPAIIASGNDGSIFLYQVNSKGGLDTSVKLGEGWERRQFVIMDLAGNGAQGIVARDGATLIFQASDGHGELSGPETVIVTGGWSDTTSLAGVSGHYGDRSGLVAFNRAGRLRYLSSSGAGFAGVISYPEDRPGALVAGSRQFA